MNNTINKIPKHVIALVLGIGIYLIGYQVARSDFQLLIAIYAVLFFGLFQLQRSHFSEKHLFGLGLALRITLLFSVPILSDDYFRFLWDGFLINEGYNPFEYKPSDLIEQFQSSKIGNELFTNMNSPDYYSIYPPVNQWIFFISTIPENIFAGIVIIRLFILGFEIGTYLIIKKILHRYNLQSSRVWWYWLNPLVILELTGNLHSEGILIFFLLFALHNFAKLKDFNGGLLLGLSVLSKLFSLMFFPLILLKARLYRSKKVLIGAVPIIIIAFLPFLNWLNFTHFLSSIDLYFQSFEFNGSLFNIVRWLGFKVYNYDIIKTAGPLLSIISLVLILLISWLFRFRNRLQIFKALTLIISVYLFFSPIVHPWYCILPLTLSLFTEMRFMIAWTATVFLSYVMYSADVSPQTKTILLVFEYGTMYTFLFLDLKNSFSVQKIKTGLQF